MKDKPEWSRSEIPLALSDLREGTVEPPQNISTAWVKEQEDEDDFHESQPSSSSASTLTPPPPS